MSSRLAYASRNRLYQFFDFSQNAFQFELLHDQLPLAVPCYDLVLVIELTVGRDKRGLRALPTPLT